MTHIDPDKPRRYFGKRPRPWVRFNNSPRCLSLLLACRYEGYLSIGLNKNEGLYSSR